MRYFYWVTTLGKAWPRASASDPTLALQKPTNIVSRVIRLSSTEELMTLTQLATKYPLEEIKK